MMCSFLLDVKSMGKEKNIESAATNKVDKAPEDCHSVHTAVVHCYVTTLSISGL